jgi:hypothetical protein
MWYLGLDQVFLYGTLFTDISAILVEWLEGGIDHGDGFDHWEGPVMADLVDGANGRVDMSLG